MDAMFQQCMQMMSQMNGMTLAPARSAGVASGMMGSGMMGSAAANGMVVWASPWFWLGWVFILALSVLLISAVVWMIRATRRSAAAPETPLSILQRRLARGEVSPEQFETIKRQLAWEQGRGTNG
jgi:uncharacterized membrane protein